MKSKLIINIAKGILLVYYALFITALVANISDVWDVDGFRLIFIGTSVFIAVILIVLAILLFTRAYLGLLLGSIVFGLTFLAGIFTPQSFTSVTGLLTTLITGACLAVLIIATIKAKALPKK